MPHQKMKFEFDGGKQMQDIIVVNQKPYTVVRLLGHGKGGYSYLFIFSRIPGKTVCAKANSSRTL